MNDILFIESICADRKFFSQRMLVPVNDAGEEVSLDELGIYVDENAPEHLTSDAIKAVLRQAPKKIEAWLESISDPAELDAIYAEAKLLDLPSSKTKILSAKMPEKDWLGD